MVDSLSVATGLANCYSCECHSAACGSNLMDTILAIAMAIIAIVNVFLTFYIYRQGRKESSEGVKKQRKFELMQTLILDNRGHLLYGFYDSVSAECRKLLDSTDQQTKVEVKDAIIALQKKFRQDFIMPFNVVDHDLFIGLKETADSLIDGITEAIFDEGINLDYEPKYNEIISEPLSQNRNALLAKLCEMANLEG